MGMGMGCCIFTLCIFIFADYTVQREVYLFISGLWALYNNAGYATAGEIEWVPVDIYQGQMDVNFLGTVRVTKSVLHLIREAKGNCRLRNAQTIEF